MAWISCSPLFLAVGGSSSDYDQKSTMGQLPPAIIEQIKAVLKEKAPKFETVVDESGFGVTFSDNCDSYLVHWADKGGQWQEKSRAEMLPNEYGWQLSLDWRAEISGRASGGYPITAGTVQDNYSMSYRNCYQLTDNRGYVELSWNFGRGVKPSILATVRAELATVGKEVSADRVSGWETKSEKLRELLTAVLKKHHSEAKLGAEGEGLACEFRTTKFDIHPVDDTGIVKRRSQRETGPQGDGFIIRLSPLELAVLRQPRPMYGVSYGPYWKHYFAIYDENDLPFRVDILYGERTDKKPLKEFTETLDEHFNEPERF